MYYKELSSKLLGPVVAGSGRSAESQIIVHRYIVLAVTFVIYATYHASRRPMSIVKAELHENCTLPEGNFTTTTDSSLEQDCGWAPFDDPEHGKDLLGILDSCYLFVYAFCMFGAGYVAERSNLRYFLSIWLAICGVISIAMGLAHAFNIHKLWYFVLMQVAAGIAQTSGWPAVVAVVGEWYGTSKKGLILGLWNWHTSVGNIIGALVAGAFVEQNWGLSFIVPGLICIGVGILVFVVLIPKPSAVGLHVDFAPTEDDESIEESSTTDHHHASAPVDHSSSMRKQMPSIDAKVHAITPTAVVEVIETGSKEMLEHAPVDHGEQAITIWKALQIPGVIEFSICLFFAKLVSYTFLFWLPLYLEETSHLSSSGSAFQSIMFDIGGCLGSIVAGFLADRTGASGITCIVFLLLAIPSLYSYYLWSAASTFSNQALQFVAGAFVNGPYALITTAVSANLACKVPSQAAMATVSAIIDGTGSIGAAVGPLLAPIVSAGNKWSNVFYMCIGADVVATLALSRIGYEEFKRLRYHWKHGHHAPN